MRMFWDTLSPSSDYGLAKGEASEEKVASNSQKSAATHEEAFGMKHLYLPFGTLAVGMVVTVFPHKRLGINYFKLLLHPALIISFSNSVDKCLKFWLKIA